ncbi:hypothetical protein COF61_25195 [Bacillus toyonensis]|uniref:hypothetical protein n=1 Tax=Bacillus toyonensis TaxID=155322 RepID=UPI000BFC4673|nr:hypothetical protein [Bacillus toyonensis]PHD57194.1 hypothetical protein COF61_25195 [Bacillus toyonensis]
MKKTTIKITIFAVILLLFTYFTKFYRGTSTGMVITVLNKIELSEKYYLDITNYDHPASRTRIQVPDQNLWNLIQKDEKYFVVIKSAGTIPTNEFIVFKKENRAILDQIKYLN